MSVTSTDTTQSTPTSAKDYHSLSDHHAILNHLKANNGKNLITNNYSNGRHIDIANDDLLENSKNASSSINCNTLTKLRSQSALSSNMIVDNVNSGAVVAKSSAATTNTSGPAQTTTTTTTNVAMFVNNHHHYHHHHHQHHIHQHININNNNNNSNNISPSNNANNNNNSNSNNVHINGSSNSINNNSNSGAVNGLTLRKSYQGTDPSNASFSSASVADSIQDDNMSDQCSLTQAGLEEYNSRSYYDQAVFHHQKQSSYAQSEGYHSYVSSSDSSSATPFLDRLRQESELLSRQSHHWSQNDLTNSTNNSSGSSSNINNDNNSSESTSSTETLKWLGSMSDVSVASHATNSSAISGSVSSSSQLIVHSSRVRTPKRQNSESVLYMNDDQMSVTSETSGSLIGGVTSNGKIQQSSYQSSPNQHYHHHTSSPSVKAQITQQSGSGIIEYQNNSSTSSLSSNNGTTGPTTSSQSSSTVPNPTSTTVTTVAPTATAPMVATSSTNSSYRNNHRLFPVSTYTEPVNGTTTSDYQSKSQQQQQQHHQHHHHHQYQPLPSPQTHSQQQSQLQSQSQQPQPQQMPGIKLSSSQSHNWQSVADRINDFERQQQHLSIHHHHAMQQQSVQKYTYIDPSKTHRVPNPTLKAFQKNAVQSYFERQQQNSKENSKNSCYSSVSSLSSTSSSSNGINGNSGSGNHQQQRPQSLQLPGTPKEVTMPQIRSSLPNDFGRSSISLKSPSAQQLLNTSLVIQQISDDSSYAECGVPPPPPPRSRSLMPVRRSSSASDYADFREHFVNGKDKTSVIKEQLISTVSSPEKSSFNDCGVPPPPPPPRGRTSMPVRRTSSASEYAAVRDKNIQMRQNLSKDLLGPIIMGPIISVDDWVPERPPKNPHLRVPSPDLPPPPMQMMDNEGNLINQDEPLPPPPPEILRHIRQSSETDIKPPSPSRRNSFAGSPSRKTIYHSASYDTPPIPKKPTSMDIMQSRPLSSLAQSHKAHKVILNGKLETPANLNGNHPSTPTTPPVYSTNTPTFEQSSRANDIRMSVRKRAHNPNMIHHSSGVPSNSSPDIKNGANKQNIFNLKSPPPLKPRMPIAGQEMRASSVAINSKLRCNSKASYLPRQTRDKLNTTDPDHGSYKLTLTSNEDSINHNNTTSSYHDDILSGKCSNLPDVLPLGAKIQPSSPASSASSPRYGSNNNIMATATTQPHTAPALIPTSYPMKSMFHFQPPVTNHTRHSTSSPSSHNQPTYNMNQLSRSTSSPQSSSDSISPKYMSQSTIDLKKTHIIESANKHSPGNMLSPAQSENNIYEKQTSPYSMKRDFQSIEGMRKLSLEERDCNEGRIVRAELVNTILSASPPKSEERMITRKDSLRENIEKITQLQSKLMSAHLSENSLLAFSRPSSLASSTATLNSVAEKETSKIDNMTRSPPKTLSPLTHSTSNKSSPVIANSLSSSPCSDKASKSTTTNLINEDDRISQMDSEVDGLKLMQRTEIVLRLNAPTSEAASQTDETLEDELVRIKFGETKNDLNKSIDGRSQPTTTTTRILTPRKPHPDEIDCDNYSKDFANQLSPSDKLYDILSPKIYKSTSDYVTDLYNTSVSVSNNTARSVISKRDVGTSTPNNNSNNDKSIGCELDNDINSVPTTASNTPTLETPDSGYYSVVESKPKSVAKSSLKEGGGDVIVNGDSCDLIKKKEELVNRLTKKLTVLGNEQTVITEESTVNDTLGSDLTTKIAEKVRPIDATKFRTYVDDVGHITMLLLSLSGRLAKAENTLQSLEENHEEKKILEVKRNRLLEQLEEAKRLKEDIDRRGTVVGKILEKHLSIDEYADYDYFINMKAKLIVDSREIADKIKISEEQLIAIKDTLVQSDC